MKTMPLTNLGTLKNGMNYDKSASITGCKIIGVADFQSNVFPNYSDLAEIDSSIVSESDLLQNGDIVFVRSNGNKNLVGRSMFITDLNESVCYSGFCISLRPNSKVVLPEYLFYALRSPYCRKQYSYSQQTNITNLSQAVLGTVRIPIVPYSQQKALAEILYSIDKKIALNKRINAELEALAKTLYDYWFVQFDFPDENGKPYRTSGGAMKWNEQLKREIPKGWKVESVLSAFDVCYGYPFDTELFTDDSTQAPIVRIRDILNCETSAYTTESVDEKYYLRSKDLVIGMDGNFHMNFWSSISALLNQRCVRIRGNGCHSVMQAFFTSMPYIQAREKNVNRTTVGHLSADDIKALYVLTANNDQQQRITAIFDSILDKICASNKENLELTHLRDWLLPMLMNGQATVSVQDNSATGSNIVEMPKTDDERFSLWLQKQGIAARGELDKKTLRDIFDAMDDDDK